jgi:diguanylate cyclase (GGDEF)-like protein/PAS domain S-box-containing protein
MEPPKRILVVEDDPAVAEHLRYQIESLGYVCAGQSPSGEAAIRLAAETRPDLVLMDIVLEGAVDGIAAAETIRRRHDIPVIYLTAYTSPDFLERAKITEPLAYLVKPCESREMRAAFAMALYKKDTEARLREQARLTAALLSLSEGVLAYDLGGGIFQANAAAGRMLGRDAGTLLRQGVQDVLNLREAATRKPMVERLLYRLETEGLLFDHHDLELVRHDGQTLPVRLSGSRIRDDHDRIVGSILLLRDDSHRKRMEENLRQAAAVYASTSEGVLITNASRIIEDCNEACTHITGYTLAELIGRTPAILKSGRQDEDFYRALWQSLSESGVWQGELWNRRKNGEIYPQWMTIRTVRNSHDEITHYVAVYADISRIRQSEEQLAFIAQHDILTGLPNRVVFQAHLEHAILRAQRETCESAVLLLDLDRFKHINDTLGHPVGDRLLVAVAERLKQLMRGPDVLARLGGDEFGVILEELCDDTRDPGVVAQKMLAALTQPFDVAGQQFGVSASIGIGVYPRDGSEVSTLMRNAEMAMYRAKEQGRNGVQFFDPAMTTASVERFTLENQLHQALERREFEVHYQPLLCLSTGRIVSTEALVRWRHPTAGLIPPLKFIPLAEESGLIESLGLWVLKEACRQTQSWQEAGATGLNVAVNLSARQFRPGLVESVAEVLRETGFPAECLELEITESVIMEAAEESVRILDALKTLGVKIAIDDFGTGYSSLSYLKRFPVDKLKIDSSFIADIPRDPHDIALVKAVIGLAGNFALRVTAEGVETLEQQRFLENCGCHTAQGYYISAPLPAGDGGEFIRRWNEQSH